jgi:hypothetical protein
MSDLDKANTFQTLSTRDLLKSTVIAGGIAAVVLAVAILPAEYGIDPTGLGGVTGLLALSQAEAEEATMAPAAEPGIERPGDAAEIGDTGLKIAKASAAPFRNDTTDIALAPGQDIEFKVLLNKGDTVLYSWRTAGASLYFDFHGEPTFGPAGYFRSYEARIAAQSHGALLAPFSGTHGWYWKNVGTQPVVISLRMSGFYEMANTR